MSLQMPNRVEVVPASNTRTPEHPSALSHGLGAALHCIDHGVLLVGADRRVEFANHCAMAQLGDGAPLSSVHGRLLAARGEDDRRLTDALAAAHERGRCRLLQFESASHPLFLAVIPTQPNPGQRLAICMLGRRGIGTDLSLQWFAQCCGLTAAEGAVLRRLCVGTRPQAVAEQQGVAISTVRTQIASIRQKTRAASIRDLVRMLAQLPPMRGAQPQSV